MSTLPGVDGSQLTGIVHVSEENTNDALYIKDKDGVEGAIRIIPDTSLGTQAEFQLFSSGVWNDTGIQIASSTVFIGRDLAASAAGEWVQTQSVNTGEKALLPHVNFDDEGSEPPHAPETGKKIEGFPIQPDDSSEVFGRDLQQVTINPASLLASKLTYKTGSVGSTQPVQLTFRRGIDVSAPIFWQRTLAFSKMATPNTQFDVDLGGTDEVEGFLEGVGNESIHTQFLSDANISLASNSGGDFFAFADFTLLAINDLVQANLLLTDELGIVFNDELDFVTGSAF